MAVINPNLGDVPATTFPAAATTSRSDEFARTCDAQGTGVIANPTVTGAGTLTVTYGAGQVAVDGTTYSFSGSTIAVTTNSGLLDRRDLLIYRVGTGITILQGTTATYTPGSANWALTSNGNPPVSPDIVETTDCILREIYMPYNATTVAAGVSSTAGCIIDKSNIIGADVLGGVLQGSSNVESIIRANTLDQFSPAAASLNLNANAFTNLGAGLLPWSGTGPLLYASYYEPSASVTRTSTSKTPTLLDTGTFTATTPYVTLTPTSNVTITCTGSTSGQGPGTLALVQGGTTYMVNYTATSGSTFTGCSLSPYSTVATLTLASSPTITLANFTVQFTAVSSAVEVELAAFCGITAAGSGGGQYYWGLSSPSSFSQQGYWTLAAQVTSTTPVDLGAQVVGKIRVTGLTPGTVYNWVWAHCTYWTTSLSATLAVNAQTVTPAAAATYYGPAIMRVFAA